LNNKSKIQVFNNIITFYNKQCNCSLSSVINKIYIKNEITKLSKYDKLEKYINYIKLKRNNKNNKYDDKCSTTLTEKKSMIYNETQIDNILNNIVHYECKLPTFNLKECINWALTKPEKIIKQNGMTNAQQLKEQQEKEKNWGNKMIGQTTNGQWTTLLGENLVYEILRLRGENPMAVKSKNGFKPDWETDEYMYEVKTSNWCVSGTAGEKVYGTFIKYQDIPELYGKPLRIICVANQEYEFTNKQPVYFGNNVTKKTKDALELARSWGIEYMPFSELVSTINLTQL